MPELFLPLKFNHVLTSIFIPLGEMPLKTRTRFVREKVHKAFDTESDWAPFPSPRRRGHSWGKGRGRSARQVEEPAPEEEPINLAVEIRGPI